MRFVGRSFADVDNNYKVPPFTLGDAERNGWRLALNVTNIADDTYVASCQGLGACFYGERRRFTGGISSRW